MRPPASHYPGARLRTDRSLVEAMVQGVGTAMRLATDIFGIM
jgi:hypothetical protein